MNASSTRSQGVELDVQQPILVTDSAFGPTTRDLERGSDQGIRRSGVQSGLSRNSDWRLFAAARAASFPQGAKQRKRGLCITAAGSSPVRLLGTWSAGATTAPSFPTLCSETRLLLPNRRSGACVSEIRSERALSVNSIVSTLYVNREFIQPALSGGALDSRPRLSPFVAASH